jgi:hypothetical protein
VFNSNENDAARQCSEDTGENPKPPTASEYFRRSPGSAIHQAVANVVATFGPVEERASKSQISFSRRRGFAYLWCPGQYVRSHVPGVLSIALPREVQSARFKQIAHPSPLVWMHHLELQDARSIDSEVASWLREAYNAAQ